MMMKLIAVSLLTAGMASGAWAQSNTPQAHDPGLDLDSEQTVKSPSGRQGEPLDTTTTGSIRSGAMSTAPMNRKSDCQNQRTTNTETRDGSHVTQGQNCY
ncbi:MULTISPECIES: hypothetical protein [unclassified Sinorhizobium]|uniref:hypothetical protein n=1 Tax=unclassified Sinorhizobium TaxID=2613772 RepID=UPI0035266D9E